MWGHEATRSSRRRIVAVCLFLSLKRVGWLADILFSFTRILWKAIRAKFIVPFVSRKKQRYRSLWNIYGRLITLDPFAAWRRVAQPRFSSAN